jgi:hypothetical protein
LSGSRPVFDGIFSAPIKGVSGEVMEAARLDGANERRSSPGDRAEWSRLDVTIATTVAIITPRSSTSST